ncbi:MAG TPA: imidazolonepropionase [Pyrinomonadaceae bacterium]|nr:imidazolonepropionase [Pyrinomonadaceae bacterium]
MKADLVISNIGQLVTCASGGKAKRGAQMHDIGEIKNAAVAISAGKILAAGPGDEIANSYDATDTHDAGRRAVCPGFVDPHTHIVFAGNRLDEFEQKIKGADYLEILASGGGIISTVRNTRGASVRELVSQTRPRLDKMLSTGTTTCEIKTGYGLDLETEMKMLEAIAESDRTHPVDVVPTFLGAHAVPPEFRENADAYVALICDHMLPQAWRWFTGSLFFGRVPFFCDVFCEKGAFSLQQSRRVLETAKTLGFSLKAHVDEFTNLGGSTMAIQLGSQSIDHLDAISDEEIRSLAGSGTVAIVTPTVNFNFGSSEFANARKLVDAGCALALSTDYNPGSAPCPSQPMAMAIACRYQKLLPAEAMNAATVNAAHSIGLGATHGSIEEGKWADLLILDTDDYRQLAYEFGGNLVSRVIKAGRDVTVPRER